MVKARHGVVATDDTRCSRIGKRILLEKGNVVDASIASAFCLGVVNPANNGIGGGAFMVLRLANGTVKSFDMRETAPMNASQNMYDQDPSQKEKGPLSIATPGQLAGFYEVWKRYGQLPWSRLVMPSEQLARNGFKISPLLHYQMTVVEEDIITNPGLREIFAPNGTLLPIGSKTNNTRLATTLQKISKHYGVREFYHGKIGLNMIQDIQKAGGILKIEDLENYQIKEREPITIDINNLRIFTMPPPSSGGASMALILNILAQYGFSLHGSTSLQVHRLIECLKHAFAVKMNLGDPDFVNVTSVLSDMLSPDFAAKLKETIYDNMTFNNPDHYGDKMEF